jgi:hypothetical protein
MRREFPELPEGYRSDAFADPYGLKVSNTPLLTLSELGNNKFVQQGINDVSPAEYWQMYSVQLFAIASICCLYLAAKIFGV